MDEHATVANATHEVLYLVRGRHSQVLIRPTKETERGMRGWRRGGGESLGGRRENGLGLAITHESMPLNKSFQPLAMMPGKSPAARARSAARSDGRSPARLPAVQLSFCRSSYARATVAPIRKCNQNADSVRASMQLRIPVNATAAPIHFQRPWPTFFTVASSLDSLLPPSCDAFSSLEG